MDDAVQVNALTSPRGIQFPSQQVRTAARTVSSARHSAHAMAALYGCWLENTIVPLAANIPPTPCAIEIFTPGTCAGALPRTWRTLSCNANMPYMPVCTYDRPPPLVFNGSLPPGAVFRAAMNAGIEGSQLHLAAMMKRGSQAILIHGPRRDAMYSNYETLNVVCGIRTTRIGASEDGKKIDFAI